MQCEVCGIEIVPTPSGEYYAHLESTCVDNLKAQLAASEAASAKAERERRLAYAGEQVAIKQRDEARTDLLAAGAVEQTLREAAEKVAGSKLITISHGVELLCVFPEDMAALRAALSLPASAAAQRYKRLVEAVERVANEDCTDDMGYAYCRFCQHDNQYYDDKTVHHEDWCPVPQAKQALRDVGKE